MLETLSFDSVTTAQQLISPLSPSLYITLDCVITTLTVLFSLPFFSFPPTPQLMQDGKYDNLKEIQDDMLLLIKNAHYFNEPGSEIYKVGNFTSSSLPCPSAIDHHCLACSSSWRALFASLSSTGVQSWRESFRPFPRACTSPSLKYSNCSIFGILAMFLLL